MTLLPFSSTSLGPKPFLDQGGQPCSAPGTPGPLGAAGAQRVELGAGVHFVAATWWIYPLVMSK